MASRLATGLIPVAVDGKSSRRARKATATGRLHTVSAWATQGRLTLGRGAVPEGSNEVAAIPDLLATLDLAGAIVTIDAAGCQKENAANHPRRRGPLSAVAKANQPLLLQAVEAAFHQAEIPGTSWSRSTTTPKATRGTAGERGGRWR